MVRELTDFEYVLGEIEDTFKNDEGWYLLFGELFSRLEDAKNHDVDIDDPEYLEKTKQHKYLYTYEKDSVVEEVRSMIEDYFYHFGQDILRIAKIEQYYDFLGDLKRLGDEEILEFLDNVS